MSIFFDRKIKHEVFVEKINVSKSRPDVFWNKLRAGLGSCLLVDLLVCPSPYKLSVFCFLD